MFDPNKNLCVIAMPSLTYALQGESFLMNAGLYAHVIKLPANATKKGCAYGLEIPCGYLDEAAKRLEGKGIKHGELLR